MIILMSLQLLVAVVEDSWYLKVVDVLDILDYALFAFVKAFVVSVHPFPFQWEISNWSWARLALLKACELVLILWTVLGLSRGNHWQAATQSSLFICDVHGLSQLQPRCRGTFSNSFLAWFLLQLPPHMLGRHRRLLLSKLLLGLLDHICFLLLQLLRS